MQENNELNQSGVPGVNSKSEGTVSETTPTAVTVESSPTTETKPNLNLRRYLLAALAVLVLTGGLMFVLEKEGRIATGIFGDMKDMSPVALVNGVKISREDYDSSMNQLLLMAAEQGADTTDSGVVASFSAQAIDTLVNGELLRQAAIEAGMEATAEAVDKRYGEIEAGLGGKEQLQARMVEFSISDETLRRDISNEILIQGLFDEKLTSDDTEITNEEIESFYTELGGEEAGLPPLNEVVTELTEQIKINRQQEEVAIYLEELRAMAEIEILI